MEQVAALESWRALVPTILEEGSVGGHDYLVETMMPGVDGRRFVGAAHEAAIQAIARGIAPLYSATARPPVSDHLPASERVREQLALLQRACGDGARDPLVRLGDRLESALAENRLSFARVHGDLWFGNAMLSEDGSTVAGFVDWASSRTTGLPAVDLAHMLVTSRALGSRRSAGLVVRRLLDASEPLERYERELLDHHGADAADLLRIDDLVLFAWLQHTGHVLSGSKVWIPQLWLKRNVKPVLAML
jgi:aminoglycoside phosphotransferase (APT) family kinase protein